MLVGNECELRLAASPLFNAGEMRHERYQPLSLLDQPRAQSRLLRDILAGEGIDERSRVGCVGWKYFGPAEQPDAEHAVDLPAYMADTVRGLAGWEGVTNATDLLMHPGHGLRSTVGADDIAYFEFTNILASEELKRMLFAMHDGMLDYDLVRAARLSGEPFACHMTLTTGVNKVAMSGPTGQIIRRGYPLGTNISYWGSNLCRSGWVAESAADLPPAAQDYVESFAGPYFEAMNEWLGLLRPGTPGGALAHLIEERLPFEKYGIFLNPGHLIGLDEWVSSPIYAGSTLPIRSGMPFQIDIIPSHPTYGSTRMEDGVVVADGTLRSELAARYPECYARCQARRRFMSDVLGFDIPEEVLPLGNMPGIVPPFFLAPNTVFALK
jgi:hypothetical protein